MLTIQTPDIEMFDDETETFSTKPGITLQFKHTLRTVAAWEEKHRIPLLDTTVKKTPEQWLDYYIMMCEGKPPDPIYMTPEVINQVAAYMADVPTATTFGPDKPGEDRKVVTAELLYAYMSIAGIPYECADWNVNKLLTLIKTINVLQAPPEKMSRKEILAQNRRLNEERKAKLKTKG